MSETEKLLQELIQATDRTTRAVRAFVRFLFIQLAAITLAFVVFQLGIITQDSSECALGICRPNGFTTAVAALIWIGGVIWSSITGWKELGLSEIRSVGLAAFRDFSPPLPRPRSQGDSCNHCGTKNKPEVAFCATCMRPMI